MSREQARPRNYLRIRKPVDPDLVDLLQSETIEKTDKQQQNENKNNNKKENNGKQWGQWGRSDDNE